MPGSDCIRNHSVEEPSVKDILEDYGFDVKRHPEVILEDLQNFYKNTLSTNIGSSQPPGLPYSSRSANNLTDPPSQRQHSRSAGRQQERDGTSFQSHIGSVERYQMRAPQPDGFSSDSVGEQKVYAPTLRQPPSAVPAVPVPQPPVMALPPKPAISTLKESTLKICIHYLRGKCRYVGECRCHHKSTIYQWQWKRNTDLDWTDFDKDENITLEKSFSHVKEAECNLKMGYGNAMYYCSLWPIEQSSQEFKLIDKLFHMTMSQERSIKSLERIENGELWNSFCLKREQMKRKLKKDVDERHLFHGTHGDSIDAICHQGFDFRFSGKAVGTLHGKGSYFSTEAGYSNCYTGNCGKMFIALTLVGDFSKANQSFVRPPPKIYSKPHGDLFDSCVDNVENPKIFVIFDLYQVYPQYLITYE
ncbi:protein mono-ADP-ribosyltransferase TIPARP-like [Gigantopelta aegis]|uniref:protein mono-ADP-ribosyltransferase TIPARP-like n=1 Tax=Gigantopelta aegis TaxID=1735272 RepID=UPI001B88790C|nr:protein mono-ADP-ribosyltransferase TIPARP-like [Gigantopelta aegis]